LNNLFWFSDVQVLQLIDGEKLMGNRRCASLCFSAAACCTPPCRESPRIFRGSEERMRPWGPGLMLVTQ
jgi:hypothetical protein